MADFNGGAWLAAREGETGGYSVVFGLGYTGGVRVAGKVSWLKVELGSGVCPCVGC